MDNPIRPFSILLTSSVGGTDTNWRNKALSKSILAFQRIKQADSQAKYSHAELIISSGGSTFAARWRTRTREPDKGLYAYTGANILIAEPVVRSYRMEEEIYRDKTRKAFNNDIYPVWRILMQGISAFVFPWIVKLGAGGHGVCSEVVAYHEMWMGRRKYWRGTTPAMLEDDIRNQPHKYDIVFEGVLRDKRGGS